MRSFSYGDDIERRYVFVCGLHRSGTSVLGRNIARMENCTGFKDTGAIEDEGQFLQDVYPISKVYGGAGKIRLRSSSAPDREVTSTDTRERAETEAELGTLLGPQQGDPR